MSRRHAHLFLSAAGWSGFVAVMGWTMAFLAGVVVPRTVDGPARTTTGQAVAIDLALLLLLAAQHSVMARRQVKAWLRRRIPVALERTSYVLATDACLALLLMLWQPWGGQLWHVGGVPALVLWSLCAAGWALAITSTFAVDHLELLGLRQVGSAAARDPDTTTGLRVDGLYAVVRHPLMTGCCWPSGRHHGWARRTCCSPSPRPATSPWGSRSRSATSVVRSESRTTTTPQGSPPSCPDSAPDEAPRSVRIVRACLRIRSRPHATGGGRQSRAMPDHAAVRAERTRSLWPT